MSKCEACGGPLYGPAPKKPKVTYVYRVTERVPHARNIKWVVPLATRQRVGSLLAYQRELEPKMRMLITIERKAVYDQPWEECTADFDIPEPE